MIPLFLLTGDIESPGAQLLAERFEEKTFDRHIANIDASRAVNKKEAEWFRIKTILDEVKDKNRGVLIVKDSTITFTDADTVSRAVTAASTTYDLFHLCRWESSCNYTQPRALPNSSVAFVECEPPDGIQAIYLSPRAVGILTGSIATVDGSAFSHQEGTPLAEELRSLVRNNDLSSGSTTNNLFHYNILAAQSDEDRRKTVECSFVDRPSAMAVDEEEDFGMSKKAKKANNDPLRVSVDAPVVVVKKRGRVGWFLIILILLLLVGGLIAYFVMQGRQKQ